MIDAQQIALAAAPSVLPTLMVLVGILISNSRIGDVNARISDLNANLGKRIDDMNGRIGDLNGSLSKRIDDGDASLRAVIVTESARLEAVLRADIQRVESRVKVLEDRAGLVFRP